jgi:Flp pilus assembly pilin Flp
MRANFLVSQKGFIRNESGQSITEYAILLSLVGGAVVGISQLSDQIKEVFQSATDIFQNIATVLVQSPPASF